MAVREPESLSIPWRIYVSGKLKDKEMLLLGEIIALDKTVRGCHASNDHFASHLDVSPRYVRKMISTLEGHGLVRISDGRGRGCVRKIRAIPERISTFGISKKRGTTVPLKEGDKRGTTVHLNDEKSGTPVPLLTGHKRGTTVPEKGNYSSGKGELQFPRKVEGNIKEESSTTVERREGREPVGSACLISFQEGRDAFASATSLDAWRVLDVSGRGSPRCAIRFADCPQLDADAVLASEGAEQIGEAAAGEGTGTPCRAPWHGKRYSGKSRADLDPVEDYGDIARLCEDDPVWAAMCVTGETMAGGYGFWVKWLGSWMKECYRIGIDDPLANAKYIFSDYLSQVWGESGKDGLRSLAAIFNIRLKELWEIPS